MKTWIIAFILPISIVVKAQIITTYCGGGMSVCEGCLAVTTLLPDPVGLTFDGNGTLFFASSLSGNRIRKITNLGVVTTVAGTGAGGFSGDGSDAILAKLSNPSSVRLDTTGNLYIADFQNARIRKVDAVSNNISTIAGIGTAGYNGDAIPATNAMIRPNDICLDKQGNIYIADFTGRRVRKIVPTGIITTYAGLGTVGYSGDGGQATAAELSPNGIVIDDTGSIYVADPYANVVRKIDTFGVITTIAGNGLWTYAGDGVPATDAQIQPNVVAVDKFSNLYVGDPFNKMVFRINLISGILTHVAGNGSTGFTGDGGAATSASLDYPTGLVTDDCGNLYISEANNRRIRKVTFNPPTTPTVAITGITTASVGATVTVNATVTGAGGSYSIKWMNRGIQFATTTVPTVTYAKAAGTDTITARVVPAITYCYDSTTSAPHMVSESTVRVSWLSHGIFSVYPNPVHSTLSISGGEVINSVTITNMVGEVLIKEQPDEEATQISIAHLTPGMYLLRVNDVYVQRFMKE